MGKTRELTEREKKMIIRFVDKGKSYREIARMMEICKSTVGYVVKKFRQEGCLNKLPRSGRLSKITQAARRLLARNAEKQPQATARHSAADLATAGIQVHHRTIQHHLKKVGLYGQKPRHKLLLKAAPKKRRFVFAKKYLDEPDHFSDNVLWSNESKI